jgi:acyl-CoA thioesterase
MRVPPGDFLRDSALTPDPDVPGRSSLEMSPAWNVFYTFGGMTMAVALRAACDHVVGELGRDDLHPITANALFCAPLGAGRIQADVTTLRAGRTAAQVRSELRQGDEGGPALAMLVTFGERHADALGTYDGITFPADVRPPDECPARPDPAEGSRAGSPFPVLNFDEQTDWRPAQAGFTWEDGPARSEGLDARFAAWFRLKREPRLPDGTIDPVSYCVPADMLGAAVARRLGPLAQTQPFFVLSLEINLQLFATTDSPWMLQDVVSQHAADGYAYGTTELWDGNRRLVGFATQRARLRPIKPGEGFGTR